MSTLGTTFSSPLGSMASRVWIVEGRNSNSDVKNDEQKAFQVVTLLILEESTNGEKSEDEHDEVENCKVEIKTLVEAPADNDGKRGVKESSL